LELLELKNMLKKTEIFLEESRLGFSDADENTSKLHAAVVNTFICTTSWYCYYVTRTDKYD
jgi:hypothetical protein